MQLPNLRLFSNVPITRDYSVTHDMDRWTWFNQLVSRASPRFTDAVNYYRIPDRIRIEGVYDDIRRCTYGVLSQERYDSGLGLYTKVTGSVLQNPIFFWVDSIRLVKAASYEPGGGSDPFDVIELTITPDVWSNCGGLWSLRDSYVVRRHMDRWKESSGVYSDIYYPNAAGDVEGAYDHTLSAELTPMIDLPRGDNGQPSGNLRRLRAIIVSALDNNGEMKYYIGMDEVQPSGIIGGIYFSTSGKRFFQLEDICRGNFYTETGLTAEYIQSIVMVPLQCIGGVCDAVRWGTNSQKPYVPLLADVGVDAEPGPNLYWYKPDNGNIYNIRNTVKAFTVASANPYLPDTSLVTSTARALDQEPMMFREPAVKRTLVNGIGGSITEIPDVDALEKDATILPVTGSTGTRLHVFAGSDIFTANAKGSVGSLDAPTMPVYNSAWQSYNAISRVGDTIQYNASQASTFGSTLSSLGMSMAGGFLMGGPVGAALGGASAVGGGIASGYSNKENLRAKRQVIKNSPCTVIDMGNGLGSALKDLISYHYVAVRMDDLSSAKLEEDYYWRGYFTERFYSGPISLDTREYFDFIMTSGARVRGSVNAEDAAAISAILDNGTTVVHDAAWLFAPDTTKNNRENSLI